MTLDELGAADPAGAFDSLPIWRDGSTTCRVCQGTTAAHLPLIAAGQPIPCPLDPAELVRA